jgi:periplasmic divalent cation tolerance protein
MLVEYIQIFTTTEKKEDAERIAEVLVENELAACIQIIGPILSIYRWKENVETVEEWMCIIKSHIELYEELEKSIKTIHPYETPEIIVLPILKGNEEYLNWVSSVLRNK